MLPASYSISDSGSTGRFALSLELFHGRAGRSGTSKASRLNLNTAVAILFSLNAKYNLESSAGATTRHQLICVFILFESLKESCGLTDGINYFLWIFFEGFATRDHFRSWFQAKSGSVAKG